MTVDIENHESILTDISKIITSVLSTNLIYLNQLERTSYLVTFQYEEFLTLWGLRVYLNPGKVLTRPEILYFIFFVSYEHINTSACMYRFVFFQKTKFTRG